MAASSMAHRRASGIVVGVDTHKDLHVARAKDELGRGLGEITIPASATRRKKRLPAIARARLERFEEGACTQVLHVGPFSAEGPTILELHAFIHQQGHSFDGMLQKHHEIYLNDPRRSAPPEAEDHHPPALLQRVTLPLRRGLHRGH